MFDISFTEILVIAVVGLVVLGPERLPQVARTLGHLFGRAQRYVNDVKNDIQREMELEELRKLKTSVQDAARSIENTVREEINQCQELADAEAKSITAAASVPPLGILTEIVAPDFPATSIKPPAPRPAQQSGRSKPSLDEAAGADVGHSH
ncbi:sec-independent protein translocase protein TatB [Nitrosospira sp. Nl5]|uniref:Sec-independent protein translocase protein TatB n=1 Tax=Nitrosospira sp. Nl5 TaxID=200120 RepID=UPI00088E212C|nr:Sec-independent protein translocase protein TatB [Nitrosospira sp. Nl5]SCY81020.1 sec-independent protein translocase protein TatB [Nitrosospira sp. Nl5]